MRVGWGKHVKSEAAGLYKPRGKQAGRTEQHAIGRGGEGLRDGAEEGRNYRGKGCRWSVEGGREEWTLEDVDGGEDLDQRTEPESTPPHACLGAVIFCES
jgi:hypothetical protein